MKSPRLSLLTAFALSLPLVWSAAAQTPAESKGRITIQERTAGMEKFPGYFPFYWDEKTGKLWLEIDKWDTEFLYVRSLPAGVGSDGIIGLDRGQLRRSRVVMFQRVGPKVFLVRPNYQFRAISDDSEERRAVRESFPQSVIWGSEIAAEEGKRVLVDASSFFLSDPHDLTDVLRWADQGRYEIDVSRSAFYLPRTKNFPKNTEVEVTVTVVGDNPGDFLWQVVPDPEAITVRQHHSFIELPDAEYKPRIWDPRSGLFTSAYMDFAAPIGEPVVKRFVARHRLQKKKPNAPVSEPVEPIVYYVDPAAPEPIRSALLEGASWWNEAFEAAGYINAFRVEILPEGADPMDVRYNVIQWVHRSTGGRSPASTVRDPRTGEIIKGHVTIASLRVREHYLLAEALLAPYERGKPLSPDVQRLALARMRQLVAHEVGHTLGLRHNFAASVNDRASVMDYPLPLVKVNGDGSFDLSDAYATGIGEWDKAAIAYAYQEFKGRAEEERGLSDILSKATARGLHYVSDPHARAAGGANPLGNPYDNGTNPVDELHRVLKVRAHALGRVSEKNLREGAPLARLEEVLVPLYMYHRYQVEAASKLLGGLYYTYTVRGDGQNVTERVPPHEQRSALAALLGTIEPDVLAFPESVLDLIPPLPPGVPSPNPREVFERRTGFTFDPLSAAEATAHMTVRLMLHPERAARLVEYHARDDSYPGLAEVLDKLIESTWQSERGPGYYAEIGRVVDNVVIYNMMSLCANGNSATQVRAVALLKLEELKNWLRERQDTTEDESQRAHFRFAVLQIERFLEDPAEVTYTKPIEPPPGEDWKLPWLAW